MGNRNENRLAEKLSFPVAKFITKFIFKKYRSINGKTVANAVINSVINPNPDTQIWEGKEIFELAGEK